MKDIAIVTRAKGGTEERESHIVNISIPDCWHAAQQLNALGTDRDRALEAVMPEGEGE